jgi:hypothetical protein
MIRLMVLASSSVRSFGFVSTTRFRSTGHVALKAKKWDGFTDPR